MTDIDQEEFTLGNHGICLTQFSKIDFTKENDEDFLNMFLKTKFFSYDCLPKVVKTNTDLSKKYLRPAFDENKIFASDFKTFDKLNLISFFHDFTNDKDMGEEFGNEIRQVWKSLSRILVAENSDKYFLLNKEWFKKGNIKVNDPDGLIYTYYILLIWLDRKNNKLTVCTWYAD